jgi:pimeloyl-ACP methyl ester carboxylesterase
VVLLHAYKGSRTDLRELALKLQADAHAVIALDLRGHGASAALSHELRADDLAAMSARGGDLEAVKSFLFDRNNAGELNVEKLCVVGVDMGAAVALRWAATDWSWEPLRTFKQGQDVKALVLVSPEWAFRGARINEAVAHPNVRKDLSVLIVAGRRSSKFLQEATRLHNALARYHVTPPADEAEEKQTLWLKTPSTSLQGTQLLNEKSLQIDDMILEFIDLRLVRQSFAWSERKHPFE